MAPELVSIAGNGTGNQLVIARDGERLQAEVLVWNHERCRTKPWSKDLAGVLRVAEARLAKIERLRARRLPPERTE
jgi:hypothetical protein